MTEIHQHSKDTSFEHDMLYLLNIYDAFHEVLSSDVGNHHFFRNVLDEFEVVFDEIRILVEHLVNQLCKLLADFDGKQSEDREGSYLSEVLVQ